jgi:hypothetical protein
VLSPRKSVEVYVSPLASGVTGARLAHHPDAPRSPNRQPVDRWTGCRTLAKKPKPGDLSVLGLRLSNHFTRRDRCQFHPSRQPGSGRRACPLLAGRTSTDHAGVERLLDPHLLDARLAMVRADALLRRAEVRADAVDVNMRGQSRLRHANACAGGFGALGTSAAGVSILDQGEPRSGVPSA